MSAWAYLAMGILCEVVATTSIKLSDGFENTFYSAISLVGFSFALYFIAMAVKTIEISTAYAIWSGVGVALITAIGVLFFGESFSVRKVTFILLIVIGVVGLQTTESSGTSSNDATGAQ